MSVNEENSFLSYFCGWLQTTLFYKYIFLSIFQHCALYRDFQKNSIVVSPPVEDNTLLSIFYDHHVKSLIFIKNYAGTIRRIPKYQTHQNVFLL